MIPQRGGRVFGQFLLKQRKNLWGDIMHRNRHHARKIWMLCQIVVEEFTQPSGHLDAGGTATDNSDIK